MASLRASLACLIRFQRLITTPETLETNLSQLCRRNYRRDGLSRRPLQVLSPEEAKKKSKPYVEAAPPKVKLSHPPTDMEESTINLDDKKGKTRTIRYQKLGEKNTEFQTAMYLLKHRNRREKAGKVILEGHRLINDALDAGAELETVFFSKEENIASLPFEKIGEEKLKKVFFKDLKVWTSLTTCPGVMAVFKKPDVDELQITSSGALPVTVICDNVRDPGNMGTIIRTAAAAGCQRLLLMKGCVDAWESKVLRAGCGAHFRIPVHNNLSWEFIHNYLNPDTSVYLADNNAIEGVEITGLKALKTGAVLAERDINESEVRFVEDDDSIEQGEEVTSKKPRKKQKVDLTFVDENILKTYSNVPLPCCEYTEPDYSRSEIVLVVGGETEGISLQALKLASEAGGSRVVISTENEVESLNTSVATSVILFEMRRQYFEAASEKLRRSS